MKYTQLIALSLTSVLSTIASAQTTLITNINGYTINNDTVTRFAAIKFNDDTIEQIYQKNHRPIHCNGCIVIDGKGKTMLPGLIDAHGHVLSYGESLMQADLTPAKSEKEAVEATLTYANSNKNLTWIKGRGWNQTQWLKNTFPTAASLDKFFPNKPVWLSRVDGHAGWANTKAMALAGITKQTKAPQGGEIIRDKNGNATGVFIDNAMKLIEKNIAPLTLAEQKTILENAMNSLAAQGLTSVHDAGIDSNNLEAYLQMSGNNNMAIRINAMLYLPSPDWQQTLKYGTFSTDNDMLQFNSVKIQADGALGSRGAALIEDYSDQHGHRGLLLHTQEDFERYVKTAMKEGFQVNTHAIGDNANKIVLDNYEKNIANSKTQHLRHRVEHAQVLRLKDIPRFNALNVIASMQATHATSDKNMASDRLGEDRIKGAYAWRKLLNANAIIAAGSDFPVESPNPFFGLHASITRQDKQNLPEGGWIKEEKMTREEALQSFTIDAAYSGHQEDIIGSLSKGKKADFIIIDNDFFTMPEQDIWQIKVLETWVNGKKVYVAGSNSDQI
ncbi:amidohydrolase [Thalassotalea sp. PP2-459]|uniref:amidohydrolase n=1 Tax=Thalassotalea sp. PP2-459 TaxID=1742724 RepID=UPI0009455734|nr:amidohydrolase [Thalassotalea sp. PP2-459]OKY27478.1 amidohydrolase [Thalassotalea sp. PP2-459]